MPPAKLNGDRRYDSDVNGDRGVDPEVPEVLPYADPEDVTLKIGYPATIDPDTRPIIQFASGIFYAHEGKNATIPIMRIDNLLGTDTVEYETLPSPFEGKKFIPVKGTIKFLPGESRKKIVGGSATVPMDDEMKMGILQVMPKDKALGDHLSLIINSYKNYLDMRRAIFAYVENKLGDK